MKTDLAIEPLERFLTTREVADLSRLKAGTLENGRINGIGDFPPFIKIGKAARGLCRERRACLAGQIQKVPFDCGSRRCEGGGMTPAKGAIPKTILHRPSVKRLHELFILGAGCRLSSAPPSFANA